MHPFNRYYRFNPDEEIRRLEQTALTDPEARRRLAFYKRRAGLLPTVKLQPAYKSLVERHGFKHASLTIFPAESERRKKLFAHFGIYPYAVVGKRFPEYYLNKLRKWSKERRRHGRPQPTIADKEYFFLDLMQLDKGGGVIMTIIDGDELLDIVVADISTIISGGNIYWGDNPDPQVREFIRRLYETSGIYELRRPETFSFYVFDIQPINPKLWNKYNALREPTYRNNPDEEEIKKALQAADNVRNEAAKILGISTSGLRKAMRKYGIKAPTKQKTLDEDAVFQALEQFSGDRKKAAQMLGCSPLSLKNFISRPRFAKFRKPVGGKAAVKEEELVAALNIAKGNYTKAAVILNIASQTVGKLVKKFGLEDIYPSYHKPIPKQDVIDALELAGGNRERAADILEIHPQSLSNLITKFKLRKKFPPTRWKIITKEEVLTALIAANGVKTTAAKLLKIGIVKLYKLLDQYEISLKTPVSQLKEMLEIIEAPLLVGEIYTTEHNYYLAVSESNLLTIIDGLEFVLPRNKIPGLTLDEEMEVGDLISRWKITSKELDILVEKYFPRPKKTRSRKRVPRFFGIRINPDEDIRRLEKKYAVDPSNETWWRLQMARHRAGLRHLHDCNKCNFLGRKEGEDGAMDFYYCPGTGLTSEMVLQPTGTLVIRYSSRPDDYNSYPLFVIKHLPDRLGPDLLMAIDLAKQAGYL